MNNLVISKKKRNLIIAISLSLIIMIIGTTYAYFSWQSTNNPLVDITVEDIADVIIKGGNDINITNIGPVLDYNDGEITEFYIKKKIENNLDLTINIIPTLLPDNLKEESFKLKLLSSNDNITYNEISEINFKDKEQDNIYRLSIIDLNQNITYYKIIFYIDGNMYNPNTMKSNNFKAKIDVSVDRNFYIDSSNANAPVLADGMIPVMYDNDTKNWVKADYYNKDSKYAGYDYENKQWANAVMVTSAKRETYMNADTGIIVPENDILAYYVWIPRYKYKLFNATYASGKASQLIEVTFENGTSTTGTVTCTYASNGAETCQNKVNGNWYTHPAFTMINASGNKTELKGIWVGKFETTGSTSTPTIKPGIEAIKEDVITDIAEMYSASKLIRSTDYLTINGANKSDSHMMKNIEWGAVAYLKQSNYGIGLNDVSICYGQTTINYDNNNNFINSMIYFSYTGGNTGTTYKSYTSQATTGNIYGIYDMSGGVNEYVMGNYNQTVGNSGLTISEVPAEHIDIYSYSGANYVHLGDATGETAGWYNDASGFVNSSYPWFTRGGYYDSNKEAGIFNSVAKSGDDDILHASFDKGSNGIDAGRGYSLKYRAGFRTVLSVTK